MSATLKNIATPPAVPPDGPRRPSPFAFLHTLLPSGDTAVWQGVAVVAGLLLAAGRTTGGAAPFGLALVLGCVPEYALAAGAGTIVGSLVFLPVDLALKLTGAMLAVLTVRLLRPEPFRLSVLAAGGVLLAEQLISSIWLGWDTAQLLAILLTLALAAALSVGIRALPLQTPRGLCLWLVILVACVQRVPLFGLLPGLVLMGLAGLCAARTRPLEHSAVLSVALAAALTVTDPALCGVALAAALGTLVAACICKGERLRCAALFGMGCVLGLWMVQTDRWVPAAVSLLLSVVAFMLLPDKLLRVWLPGVPAPTPEPSAPAANPNAAVAGRLSDVAEALADVADTVNAVCERQLPPRGENYDFVVDYTVRRLCQGCKQREACWIRCYSAMVDAMYKLKTPLESRGRLEIEDLKGALTACARPTELCLTVAHGYRLWRSRRRSRAQASVLRTALTDQYAAMAGALAQLAGQLKQSGMPDPKREARTAQLFAEIGLEALECSVSSDLFGRMTAAVTVARTAFTPDELATLAAALGRSCQRDFALPEMRHRHAVTTLTFAEKPRYRAVFGAANCAAAAQKVSGDAWEQFCDASGHAQMLLCDGMGTGRAAAVDGQMAARLTTQLLQAGLTAESTARLVNVALGLKNTDQESGATLDLVSVDLYTGRAASYKAGAAPSFLLREGLPRPLEAGGTGLPIGVMDTVVGRSGALTLEEGDMLVLVSDGVLADGSDWLLQQLATGARQAQTPTQLAQSVVEGAVKRPGGAKDDITAVVLQLQRA